MKLKTIISTLLLLFCMSVSAEDLFATYVCTINNTNASRGALMYAPSQSTKWVWSSGKNSQAFNASSANCQWVFVSTGAEDEYYLYNLGAEKFAVPVKGGNYGGYTWAFSRDAVAVKLLAQDDGTYKIKTATANVYVSVSNGYTGPVINYNDIGGNFTISKVVDLSTATAQQTAAATARLIHNTTPLAATPTGDGWYAVRIRTHANYADHFLFTAAEEINYNGTLYPLDFYSEAKVRPAIDNATYYAKLTKSPYGHYWQMPNGRYLQNAKPVSGEGESSLTLTYNATNHFTIKSSAWYFVPYLLGGSYFIGETSSAGRAYYDIYPVSLADAGLTAWQVLCTDAPATAQISCTRSDVSGLTSVYKNGYFFLPSDVVPTASDFVLSGATNVAIDTDAKTVTIGYDPRMAIVAEGVSVSQGYATTGRANDKAVLLRMQVAPFNQMENAVMTFSLTGADNIADVKVYETGNNVEFNAISNYTNTFGGTTATIPLGTVAAGTHYYWLCATIAADAEVGSTLDAALTTLTYDYNGFTGTTCDLTQVGNPANAMKVFDTQQHLFLPTVDGDYTRIPALITADDGSLIAACDKRYGNVSDLGNHRIDIILRRSTDGGKTWSDTQTIARGDGSSEAAYGYGDPAFAKGKDGKLFCLFAAGSKGFGNGLKHIGMTTSTDNGQTWSAVVDITSRTGRWTNLCGYEDFFVTSGKGLYTSDGVLMFLLDVDRSAEKNYVLYSTDEGASWTVDATTAVTGANEAKLVELAPGKLLSSTRAAYARIFNTATYKKNADGTVSFSWGTQRTEAALTQNGSANNQDVIVYSRNADGAATALFHTITSGNGHKNLRLFMSTNQGQTWKEVMQIQPGGARYCVMSILQNGDLALLFEDYSLEAGREYPINFLTITWEQIAQWLPNISGIETIDNSQFTIHTPHSTLHESHSTLHESHSYVYDLQGRQVAIHRPFSIENHKLAKGIYIIDGRKHAVR